MSSGVGYGSVDGLLHHVDVDNVENVSGDTCYLHHWAALKIQAACTSEMSQHHLHPNIVTLKKRIIINN
jgi:hypothetical protein